MNKSVSLQGVRVDILTLSDALARIRRSHSAKEITRIYFANAHTINTARQSPQYQSILNRADFVLNDGIGVDLAAHLKRVRFWHNFCGTDFVPLLIKELAKDGVRLFLIGGDPGRAQEAGEVLSSGIPGVVLTGTEDGFRGRWDDTIARANETSASVVLVGMGNPLQEEWIDRHSSELEASIVIGVGALFDFLSGRISRAPDWMRTLRMEWLYRLCGEPIRLFPRYIIGVPAFILHSLIDAILYKRNLP